MNEAGGRFTHGCLVVCGVLTVVFLVSLIRQRTMAAPEIRGDITIIYTLIPNLIAWLIILFNLIITTLFQSHHISESTSILAQ